MENLMERQTKRQIARLKEATPIFQLQPYSQETGLLSGKGKGKGKVKKIFTTIFHVIDDLALEASHVFDYAMGKEARTTAIEQNRLKNPLWNNTGLFDYMHEMTDPPPAPKQAGLLDPNAIKFMLLLGVVGFGIYKMLPEPEAPKQTPKKLKSIKLKDIAEIGIK